MMKWINSTAGDIGAGTGLLAAAFYLCTWLTCAVTGDWARELSGDMAVLTVVGVAFSTFGVGFGTAVLVQALVAACLVSNYNAVFGPPAEEEDDTDDEPEDTEEELEDKTS